MATNEKLLSTVLGLPSSDRAHFARELLASLDEENDPGAAEEWVTEIEQRVEEIRKGTAKLEPWETVRARITARLRRRRR